MTGGGGSTFQSQVAEVESATESYGDPAAALEAGFNPAGPVAPGQGWHFVNQDRVMAAAENGLARSEPQVLTYDREMNLVAVEWAVPSEATDSTPSLFDDTDADATEQWHTHDSFTHVFADRSGSATDPADLGLEELTTSNNWAAFRPPNTDLSAGDEIALKWGIESPDANEGGEQRVVDFAATHPSFETLHMWVYKDNPEGLFHPTHSDVAGGSGHSHDH